MTSLGQNFILLPILLVLLFRGRGSRLGRRELVQELEVVRVAWRRRLGLEQELTVQQTEDGQR